MARKTGWWALALLLAAFTGSPAAGQKSPLQWPVPPPRPVFPKVLIGPAELSSLLKSGHAVPFDTRGMGPYAEGHLPGAVARPGDEEIERGWLAEQGISGVEPLVIYGDGDREAVAHWYWLLRRAGCAEARILDGGIAAWRAAGGTVETGSGRRRSPVPAFRPAPGNQATTDVDWLAESFGQAGVELLDVRDARGWERWEMPPTLAAGHIPYSLPFDPRALLPEKGWPEPAEVHRRLATLGPRPGDPVSPTATFVLYGADGSDPRLGLGYLLLTLAGFDVRVFPGGWKEWTAGSRPVVRVVSAAELAGLLRPGDPGLATDRPPRGLILLDLREPRDFAIGHLPGALNLPILRFPGDFEKTVATGWPDADRATVPLVLYCYGVDCVRSRKAGAQAAHQGFRNLIWFRGGVDEWREAGYPLFDSPLPTSPAAPSAPSAAPASPGHGDARP